MTDTNKELWKVLDAMAQEEEIFSKQLDDDANEFWENLDYDQKLLAFYAVTSRINQGEMVDKGSYRHILYETFKFGPEAYVIGMNAGLMALHNIIGDGETYQEMKQANRLEVIDENGRSYVKCLENDERLRYNMQDEGKTLKVFIDKVKRLQFI